MIESTNCYEIYVRGNKTYTNDFFGKKEQGLSFCMGEGGLFRPHHCTLRVTLERGTTCRWNLRFDNSNTATQNVSNICYIDKLGPPQKRLDVDAKRTIWLTLFTSLLPNSQF